MCSLLPVNPERVMCKKVAGGQGLVSALLVFVGIELEIRKLGGC